MAAIEEPPSITSAIGLKLAGMLIRRTERKARTRPRTWVQVTIKLLLHVAGFTCLTVAAWSFNFIAGMAVAGISCFVQSWLLNGASTVNDNPQSTMYDRR